MAGRGAKLKLIEAGEILLLRDGYHRTSVDAVCDMAEVTKGSFYYYFKSKEDIAIAVMEQWLERNAQIMMNGPHREEKDPQKIAFVYLDHIADSVNKLWDSGCLVGSLAMDMASTSDKLQQSIETIFRGFVQGHTEIFEPLVLKRDDAPSAEDLAEMLLALIEGSIVIARSYRDMEPIERAMRTFKAYLKSAIT